MWLKRGHCRQGPAVRFNDQNTTRILRAHSIVLTKFNETNPVFHFQTFVSESEIIRTAGAQTQLSQLFPPYEHILDKQIENSQGFASNFYY